MEWISVKDRLPEANEDVLFITDHNITIYRGGYRKAHKWKWEGFDKDGVETGISSLIVSHWMPITPPKEDV